MIRIINLKEYLPPYIVEYFEINEILRVENERLQDIENQHWQLIDNRFINTCDEAGIARYEKLLNITPSADDTLESRQFRVLAAWNKILPYNYRYLYNQLTTLCGNDGFLLQLEGLELHVEVNLVNKNMFSTMQSLIDVIIPCNILWDIKQLYNTHKVLHSFTHSYLHQYTQSQVRDEVL